MSIKKRLISFFSVILLLITTFSFFYYPKVFKEHAMIDMNSKVKLLSNMVALGVGIGLDSQDFLVVAETLKFAESNIDFSFAAIFDGLNETLAQKNPENLKLDFKGMLDQKGPFEVGGHLFFVVPIHYKSEEYGKLILGVSLKNINATISQNRRTSFLVSAAIFTLGSVLAFIFANALSHPLKEIVRLINDVANGKLKQETLPIKSSNKTENNLETLETFSDTNPEESDQARFTVATEYEVEILSRTCDHLTEKLQNFINVSENILDGKTRVDASGMDGEFHKSLNRMLNQARGKRIAEKKLQEASTILELQVSELKQTNDKLITEIQHRQKAEDEVRQTNEFLNNILESPTDISIVSFNLEGEIIYWNKSAKKMLGYGADERVSRGNPDILCLEENIQKAMEDMIQSISRNSLSISREVEEVRTKEGKKIWVNLSISPRFDMSGQIVGYLGMGENITQRKYMQIQLNHAQKMESIGQLAAGIAHEMNTPLQYISNHSIFLKTSFESMLRDYQKVLAISTNRVGIEPTVEKLVIKTKMSKLEFFLKEIPIAIEHSIEGIRQLISIVQGMKEFSHPGKKEKTPSNLNKAIETTLNICRSEWKFVAEIETDLDAKLPLIPCYLNDFNQILLNLVVNASFAIKESLGGKRPKKGKIKITSRLRDDWVEILVMDSGTGIPEKIRSKIFDPFFTTKEVGEGTGQGLFLVHSLVVKKHGGKISFETEWGKGTTFTVRLPVS